MIDKIHSPFHIQYDVEAGCFKVTLFNKAMLGTRLMARVGKDEAILKDVKFSPNRDKLGDYHQWILAYCSSRDEMKTFTGVIKIYKGFAVFETINHFAINGRKSKHLYGNPHISFPSFEGDDWDRTCSCFSFKRQAPFNYPELWQGSALDSLRDGKNSPLVVTNKAYETWVLSPLNHLLFGTVSINHLQKSIRCGIPRALKVIPKETNYQTMLVYGKGVNKTLERWGSLLRDYYHVETVDRLADVSLKYISYWTNAGSAYWYNSHKKQSYEETFCRLKKHHDEIGLSFGSYQLDSWWYKKEGDDYISGIVEWEPKMITRSKNFNSMIPFFQKYRDLDLFKNDRISYVQSILKRPIGCHFKQLANDSVYVQDCEEDFIIEGFPMPKDKATAKALFYKIFYHPKWRLSYIVHDWLQFMNDHHSAFRDIQVAPAYFQALDEVCSELEASDNESGHLSVQFCMTQPHMTLNSVTMKSVTSIRSTSDSNSFFVEGTKRWWWHMYSSKFIQVLGKYAFYDNRKSGKRSYHPLSSSAKFEMIMLALSCGPIGIGDKIGNENMEVMRRVIKEDGEIIKPDVPSSPLDKCYLYNPNALANDKGVAIYSYSRIEGKGILDGYQVYYLLLFNLHPLGKRVSMDFSVDEVDSSGEKEFAIYDYFSGEMSVIESNHKNDYVMKQGKFYYKIAAPVVKGFAYFGDVSKHVSCSGQLVKAIEINEDYLRVETCYEDKYKIPSFVIYCHKRPQSVRYDGGNQRFIWKKNTLIVNIKRNDNEIIKVNDSHILEVQL